MKQQNQEKPTKSKIPYLFVIFFLIVFTVDFIYIYLAEKSWRGVATENGYKKGLKYNEVIESVKEQKKLGWSSEISYTAISSKNGFLEVILTDKNKKIIANANINVKLTRPVQEGFDFETFLKYDKKTSNYKSEITFPLKGQWDVEIQVTKDNKIYQNTTRIIIQ